MAWYETQIERDAAKAKADADYYRRQAEEREAEINRMREERDRDRESARRERMSHYEEMRRQADDWPDALRKNVSLLMREARPDPNLQKALDSDDENERRWAEDDRRTVQWFADSADACRRALELWDDVGGRYAVEIERLRREWKAEVVERLKAERTDSDGWQSTAREIEQYDDPAELLNW